MNADQLRRLRHQMGLTLEEFGKLFDWSTTTTWRKEEGKSVIRKPEVEVIKRIAEERGIRL
jgi:transcriptional regulator with XRE-family HTH domain